MLYAPNAVHNTAYTLTAPGDPNTAPTDGWQWFDDDTSAYAAYGLTMPPPPGPGQ